MLMKTEYPPEKSETTPSDHARRARTSAVATSYQRPDDPGCDPGSDIGAWSQLRPSHTDHTGRESPAWSDSVLNRLGHASGRLPSDRDDRCMAWHWPGDPVNDGESTGEKISGVIDSSFTWARLAAKAKNLCNLNDCGVEV